MSAKTTLKALSIVLVFSLLFSFVGCASKNTKVRVVSKSDSYYSCDEITLDIQTPSAEDKELKSRSFRQINVFQDCVIVSVYEEYVIPEELEKEMDEFWNNFFKYTEEDALELQNRYNSYFRNGLACFDMDGNMKGFVDIPSDSEIVGMNEDAAGNLKILLSSFIGNGYAYEICDISSEGSITNEISLNTDGSSILNEDFFVLGTGNFLCYEDAYDGSSVLLFSSEGMLLSEEKIIDPITKMSPSIDRLLQVDGKFYACYEKQDLYDDSVMPKMYMYEIDPYSAKTLGEAIESTSSIHASKLIQGQDGVYAILGNGIEKVDFIGEDSSTILSWNETDCNHIGDNPSSIGFRLVSENDIYLTREVISEQYQLIDTPSEIHLLHIKRESTNPHAGKQILYLAYIGDMRKEFLEYLNTYNLDPTRSVRIIVADYSGDSSLASSMYGIIEPSSDELSLIVDQIYTDILSGDGPDILLNFGSFSQFDTDRVLVDLNTLIDGENALDRNLLFDNILRAYERDGKLYQLPLNFSVTGMVANKAYVGDRIGWAFEETEEISESLPDNCTIFGNISQSDMLQTLIEGEIHNLLDYDNQTVMFDSPAFKEILEMTNKFGIPKTSAEILREMSESVDVISEEELFDSGAIVALKRTVHTLSDFGIATEYCNGNVCFIGTPNSDGSGAKADDVSSVAISKSCPNVDEAWDFLRYLLEDDIQLSLANSNFNFPVNRNAFETQMNQALEENQLGWELAETDEGYFSYMTNLCGHLTEDDKARLQEVIECINGFYATDPSAMIIIEEEVPGYFLGQKTVDDVVAIIQSRSETVVQERG